MTVASNDRLWHQLGRIQYYWSYELKQIYLQEDWIFSRVSMFSFRNRGDTSKLILLYSHYYIYIINNSQVLMLTTNMIRKDLNSQNQYDAGVALSGLACFINQDLARDLANDLMTLVSTRCASIFHNFNCLYFSKLSSTKPYIRKKAVLLMYKVFLAFPDALRPAFPRLKEKLEDPDPGITKKMSCFVFIDRLSIYLSFRRAISSSQCCMWIGKKEPQELSQFSPHLFQIDDILN